MSHFILDRKNRELIKLLADQSLEMEAVHDAFEGMPEGSAKTAVSVQIDTHSDSLSDNKSDLQGQFDAIKTAVGL